MRRRTDRDAFWLADASDEDNQEMQHEAIRLAAFLVDSRSTNTERVEQAADLLSQLNRCHSEDDIKRLLGPLRINEVADLCLNITVAKEYCTHALRMVLDYSAKRFEPPPEGDQA